MGQVRTRFAPSPTGDLHIGGARTALFAWAFAKAHGGVCLLRIEDTDRSRHSDDAMKGIVESLNWLGLDMEGPYFQSERMAHYQAAIEKLLATDQAYRCCCSKERLDHLRQSQMDAGQKPRYDGRCRDAGISADQGPFVVRFKTPETGQVVFDDQVRGRIVTENSELDDLIIARGDGWPTYHLCVAVDDIDMGITHVIRGDDHINNTPRQIHIFEALGGAMPVFAHVSSILGEDGKKLSKRHGACGVMAFKEAGYLKEALLNYLLRLGWSHGDQEIFSREDIFKAFGFQGLQRSPAALSEEKLMWLNQHYLKCLDPSQVANDLSQFLEARGFAWQAGVALDYVIEVLASRCKTLVEMADRAEFIYQAPTEYAEKSVKRWFTLEGLEIIECVKERLSKLSDWRTDALSALVADIAEERACKLLKVAQPLRVALTGDTISPSMGDTLFMLGQAESLRRLECAIDWIQLKHFSA